MDLISKALHHLGKNYNNVNVIQIGAMDGINFDDTRGFLDLYKWNALLVEPIPDLFQELKFNFRDRHNYTYEQSAITDFDGEIEMLTIPKEIINKEGLHPGYKGMSALYPLKNGFGSDYQRDIDVKKNFGVNIKVPAITFESLLKKHNITKFDILICDAEGHDWNIFKQIDLNKYRPKLIRLEYINLNDEEKVLLKNKLSEANYIFEINQDIDAVPSELNTEINQLQEKKNNRVTTKKYQYEVTNKNLTIVTGLWDINRPGRNFDQYIENFKKFLQIPVNMFLYIPSSLENIVWDIRDKENTYVKILELDSIKNTYYAPFWEKTQKIRTDKNWYNQTGENGWLTNSPQANNEWYNAIVQSKMFLLNDVTIWNPFNTDYFIWLDAGITNTVYENYFTQYRAFDKINNYLKTFLFLSYPYQAVDEIHGFDYDAINLYSKNIVKYVCRGGLFGGSKQFINEANSSYYLTLQKSLNEGYMGTEESIFTIMSYNDPNTYRRYELDSNGLIVKFIQALIDDKVSLTDIKKSDYARIEITNADLVDLKTNLYILTFNFPEQVLHTINSMKKTPEWLKKPKLILIDNSTIEESKFENKKIAEEYNFEYIDMNRNSGICGGRMRAAQHFHESDADFYYFFEDDMTINPPEYDGQYCRNGFRKYVPNLYNITHKIMLKNNFDFLKLTFTEVYFDNDKQCSWYNVPQHIRTRDWPDYDKLPVTGLDPNVPLTNFKNIRVLDGVSYIDGEIYYANWPMIVNKEGNYKMFIETTWSNPFEQTWMSHIYQQTKENKIRPAILLASPILHDRIKHYTPEERREN